MKRIFSVFSSITFIILLLANCEKEQIVPEPYEESIQKLINSHFVKGDSIRNTNKELDLFLRTRFPQEDKFTDENSSFNSYGFAIDTEKILQLSADTYTNYIFTTHRGIPTIDNTENYVLTVFEDGSYMQLLINYPLFESAGTLTPDITNATVTYINDAMLLTGADSSPCTSPTEEIMSWSEEATCYYFDCTAGGNHSYGQSCRGSESQQPQKICLSGWVVTGCVVYGGSTTPADDGTLNGGGSTNNQPNPNNPTTGEVPVVPFIPYWQRVVSCVNNGVIASPSNISELPLSNNDITWLQSKTGAVHATAIFDFLAENGCDENTKDFVKKAVEALQNDSEVDFKHKIIIDATLKLKPCHAKVIKATFESTAPVIQLVKAAFNENTKFSYNLRAETFLANLAHINAGTNPLVSCDQGDCVMETTFNTTYLDSASDLSIAKTAIHESIHAVLGYMYKIGALQTLSTDPDFSELLVAFTTLQAATTANEINNLGNNLNDLQHEFMTELIDDMALALKDYGVSKGYNLPFSYYKKMIWGSGSMINTPNFQTEFSYFEQQEVIAIGKAESTATTQTYLINQYDEVTIQTSGTKPNTNEPCN
ncbi:hypothetical protein [uncultured Kordia sp.]|uniref:hypothetical protein n=1 Tax=uncultured Kordia sp. TaxID=507699 RepID=UPI0026299D36|nr:hypothetical protein [uncultured Kordia sp.]